jgi:thymidylate synthase (FAD)
MKIIEQSSTILFKTPIDLMEIAGRTCYQSEGKGEAEKFIQNILKKEHLSVLEHSLMVVQFVTQRAVADELMRHRLTAISCESTRYCNYSKDKFGNEIAFVKPISLTKEEEIQIWKSSCEASEQAYFELLKTQKPENARGVLPLCLKTQFVMSANLREWIHILKLRLANNSHSDLRSLLQPVEIAVKEWIEGK